MGKSTSALAFSSVKLGSLFFLQLGQHKAATSFRRCSAASNTVPQNLLKHMETGVSPVPHGLKVGAVAGAAPDLCGKLGRTVLSGLTRSGPGPA